MKEITIRLHDITVDGLPPRDADGSVADHFVGRVAFLFDGNIVSGWPIYPEDHPDFYHPARIERRAECGRGGADLTRKERYELAAGIHWEADSDVGRSLPFAGVTHWVEFLPPLWDVERGQK